MKKLLNLEPLGKVIFVNVPKFLQGLVRQWYKNRKKKGKGVR